MKDKSQSVAKGQRHDPLFQQIDKDQNDDTRIKKRVRTGKGKQVEKKKDKGEEVIDKVTSKKILARAREQLREEAESGDDDGEDQDGDETMGSSEPKGKGKGKQKVNPAIAEFEDEDDDEVDLGEEDEWEAEARYNAENQEEEINEEDEMALKMFMPSSANKGARRTLADLILEKIREKEEAEAAGAAGGSAPSSKSALNPQVRQVYRRVGALLKTYTSGHLPKAFKVIPSLQDWEDVLYLTRPDQWSPQATREATKVFTSSFNSKLAQRFFYLVLYPKIREDITEHKVLNYHYYMALKKSLYKPAAFFKGVLLPLCEEGDCTLREAHIIGSIVKKCSIPVLHSSVAIMKLAEMPYSGATSYFLKVLLDKKYGLPFRVIDGLVQHFMHFESDNRQLTTIWHQSLLVFAQRYKTDITREQKEQLRRLLHIQEHHSITPEIKRELFSSKCRDGEEAPADVTMDGTSK